jgi:hypothetical protein
MVAWHEVPGTRPRGIWLRRGGCEWPLYMSHPTNVLKFSGP